ncbi:MAG: HAD family phosphatase [Rhodoferax sp.]|nr:HAD family phosphatase [Rhodoferax sp.]
MNIVFDFGAVLFTWQPGALIQTHFPDHAATQEQRSALTHAVFGHADWHDFDRGVLTASEVSFRTAQRLGLNEPDLRALVDGIGERLQTMDDTLALLAQLRALRDQAGSTLRLYYLSNMPEPYARVLEHKHEFIAWFDGGIFSGDVKHIKPEPEIYALLERRFQLEPSQTVFIDDLASNVAHAQSRGWQGIHFESAAQLKAQLQRLQVLPLGI